MLRTIRVFSVLLLKMYPYLHISPHIANFPASFIIMDANRWKEYFVFTKKERTGIIALLVILIVIWFIPAFFSPYHKTDLQKLEQFKAQIASLQKEDDSAFVSKSTGEDIAREAKANVNVSTLFYFDPNTLPQNEWKRLGLPDKTVATIMRYRDKGGRFKDAQDLSKIYGLKRVDYERLLPYIRIAEVPHTAYAVQHNMPEKKEVSRGIQPFDINQADTSMLIALPGIGSKLANRIINFRQKLGGFYMVEQVAEVYGLPDSTYQKIRPWLICNPGDIHKININTATSETLKAHPYIKYQVANAVIQYRNQHGSYPSVEALKQVKAIPEDVLEKIIPYLEIR